MDSIDIFGSLKNAVVNIRENLKIIEDIAPGEALYKELLKSKDSPFFKNIVQKKNGEEGDEAENGAAVDVDDSDVGIAVKINKFMRDRDEKVSFKKVLELLTCEDFKDFDEETVYADFGGEKEQGEVEVEEANECVPEEAGETGEERNLIKAGTNEWGSRETTVEIEDSFEDLNIYKRKRHFEKSEKIPELPKIEDETILNKVFTHQSTLNYLHISVEEKTQRHNERLEFIGDSLLGFIVSMIIYEKFPYFTEGQLSMLRSSIVNNNTLIKYSQIYEFDKKLRKNYDDIISLTGNNKIIADVFEAYLGGLIEENMIETIEGETKLNDFNKTWFTIKSWIEELSIEQINQFDPTVAFKSKFSKLSKQEIRLLIGQQNSDILQYIKCKLSNNRIISCVKIAHKIYGYGIGTSNQEADSRAATDAMMNPGIKKICPEDKWNEFSKIVGLTEEGGLKFQQYITKISNEDIEILLKELSIKYKNVDIKMLASKNNPSSLLIDEKQRRIVLNEIEENHSINNTEGELQGGIKMKKKVEEESEGIARTGSGTGTGTARTVDKEKYYSRMYTLGRGGVFEGKEYGLVKIKKEKKLKGIYRNKEFEIYSENGDENEFNQHQDRKSIMCHEVLCNVEEMIGEKDIDMSSKNSINAIFARRGAQPDYVTYRTKRGEFITELWFGTKQIVCYGLDKNKRMSAQKAAMLAMKREEYFLQ